MSIPQDPLGGKPLEPKRPGGEMKSAATGAPTRSQLLPFGAEWQELVAKPYFLPGLFGCVTVALLFLFLGDKTIAMKVMLYQQLPVDVPMYTVLLALLIAVGGTFGIYRMAGKPKAIWLTPAVAIFVGCLVASPVMGALQGVFRISGGGMLPTDSVFVGFIKMLFRAGFPEECIKAIPIAIGAVIGARLTTGARLSNPMRQLAVMEPLDGIIIGAAAGFGFSFYETVFQYTPAQIAVSPVVAVQLAELLDRFHIIYKLPKFNELFDMIMGLYGALANGIGVPRANFELQQILRPHEADGLELMIPRVMSDIFGHAAYAGIFGYFIGLAVMKPVGRVKTLLIGLAVAASLHAMWDSMAKSPFTEFLFCLLAFVVLAVCVMKARKVSPDRAQLVPSQILDGIGARSRAFSWTGPSMARSAAPVAPPAPRPAAPAPRQAAAPVSMTWQDESNLRMIEIGTARIPATLGTRLYERQAPGTQSSRADGVVGEVTANPADPSVLGLKNLSEQSWPLTTAAGVERLLEPGRSIRLEAGMKFRIGQLPAHVR